ncbi:MAG: hypothetical protein ACKPKO_22485, partial [Candidatus Fonsibacter sp.]
PSKRERLTEYLQRHRPDQLVAIGASLDPELFEHRLLVLPASLCFLNASSRGLVHETVAISMRRKRASFLPSIRQQTSQPMPKPPHTLLFSFAEIHGWSSLLRATPLSIIF